jgi:hypothetical protein
MKFSSVVSYHTNVRGCGVANFSKQLAGRLGIPFVGFDDEWGMAPLFSLKWSELTPDDRDKWRDAITYVWDLGSEVSVFWHDQGDEAVTNCAEHVFYADPSLGSPGLWCPSLITPRKRPMRLFSFGMATRLQTDKYTRVRELLDAAGERYHLRVSVGIHEGTSLDGAEKHFDALRDIMGPEHVTILGILSDDAVSEELHAADYVLAFFEKGVRANNTTVHAALEHGRRVITNTDIDSPEAFAANTLDIGSIRQWPTPLDWKYLFSWEHLLGAMKGVCDKSRSRIA